MVETNEEVKKLANQLKKNGVAKTDADAITLAKNIIETSKRDNKVREKIMKEEYGIEKELNEAKEKLKETLDNLGEAEEITKEQEKIIDEEETEIKEDDKKFDDPSYDITKEDKPLKELLSEAKEEDKNE
jgi:hypothetical protein